MHDRRLVGVIHQAPGVATIGKATRNTDGTDGTDGIQAASILDTATLKRFHGGDHPSPFKRDGSDNIDDLFDDFRCRALFF